MTETASRVGVWIDYYLVCREHGPIVRAVESVLDGIGGRVWTVRQVTDRLSGVAATYDQVSQAVTALRALGVVAAVSNGGYVCRETEFSGTRTERQAVLSALSWAGTSPTDVADCELLLAAPADGAHLVRAGFDRLFLDLRTTIRHLIAAARTRVLLAAPFWDLEVATDLAELLQRRQQAGVEVAILARRPKADSPGELGLTVLRDALVEPGRQHVRILERPSSADPFGWSTFHFKAAAADGASVYLGSANFNTAGMASRWELGVRLGGPRARHVCQLLDELWLIAEPL